MKAYRAGIIAFATLAIGIGVTMIVVTAVRGGGVGILLGAMFIALGAGRLYLLRGR
jgi:hypothetical protein